MAVKKNNYFDKNIENDQTLWSFSSQWLTALIKLTKIEGFRPPKKWWAPIKNSSCYNKIFFRNHF
jgi:hypothetical protein